MKYHWLLPLISAVLNLGLGVIVITRDRRARLNRAFLYMSVALALWNLNNFVFYAIQDPDRALWWGRIFRTGTMLLPITVLHLVVIFATTAPPTSRWLLAGSYLVSIGLVAANALGLLVTGVAERPWGLYPIGTRLYVVYIASAIANGLVAITILIREYRKTTSPRRKLQARFWLLGALVAIPAGMGNFLAMYGIPVYPTGHLGNTIYAGIIAYAIARHRLMDIDIVVTKGVAYTAVSFVLIAPAFTVMLWLQRVSFGQVHPDFSFAVLVMLVAVGVLFPALRLRAESRIERSLFRSKHEYRAALSTFTRSIVRILDRDRLLRELAVTLEDTLQLDRIVIALIDDSKRVYTIRHALGAGTSNDGIPEGHEFIKSLAARQEAVMRDELESSSDRIERTVVADTCRQNGWEVCIPLTAGSKLIGFISLGRKRNLDTFSAGDLELLETLGAEASVALENARLYEELGRSQEIIRRADRLSALGTLAAGIAHEVRNPLVSIQTFFQLAPERLHDEEFMTTFLGMTANEVKRIADMITELLSFARSPTRTLRPVDLNEAVERVAALLEPEARKHKLTIERALTPALPLVNADADQIKQVLINLILNAIQATEPSGVVSITTRPVRRGQVIFAQLEIRDTGIGIPADRLDHIFDPFFTTKDKGTGLGLAIAHQIVAEHGGSINAQSKEGLGTTFVIDLPVAEQDLTNEVTRQQPQEAELFSRRHQRPRKLAL